MGISFKLSNYINMYIQQLSHDMKITGSATFFAIYVACYMYIISNKHLNVPFISVLLNPKNECAKVIFHFAAFLFPGL